ncbi:hypothetical protein BC830DRAFT_1097914 [Chytriomyces sp. MP71]|nr:hypothetical protein BC830DRAFT_1113614 [Chytriomyces sp. MP71]KAI8620728.1 hypothetical protein BC830DRAFT_1097914 [Chytriomyces sp. MP71]
MASTLTASDACNAMMMQIASIVNSCGGSSCVCNTDVQPLFEACQSYSLGLLAYNRRVQDQVSACRTMNPTQLNVATSVTISICFLALCGVIAFLCRDCCSKRNANRVKARVVSSSSGTIRKDTNANPGRPESSEKRAPLLRIQEEEREGRDSSTTIQLEDEYSTRT